MIVRKTLQWIATLLFLAALGGGGYAYWFFTHTNEELKAVVLRKFAYKLPNVEVTCQRCWFDFSRKVHLKTVVISAKGATEPFARCDEIVFTLDGQMLSEQQEIDLRAIRIVRPDVRLIRDADGNWNWQKLLPLVHPDPAFPEITFDDLQMAIRIERKGESAIALHVQRADVRLVPSSRRQFAVEASARLPGLGDVRCDGAFDVDKKAWALSGSTTGAANITELLDSASRIIPDVRQRLAQFQHTLAAAPGPRDAASPDSPAAQPAGEFTLTGHAAIKFQLKRASAESNLAYRVRVSLAQGEIEHPFLPFPLHGISGTLDVDNRRLILKDVQAHNDVTKLTVDGQFDLPTPAPTNRMDVKIQDLALDRRLEAKLPEFMRKNFNLLHPEGHIDAGGSLVRNHQGQWKPEGWVITHKRTSVLHRDFPYPVTDIVGTVVQKTNALVINLRGRAGDRMVKITGKVVNPGPDAEGSYQVEVHGLPISDAAVLRAAAAHPPFQRTLTELKLQGLVDAVCHFHRPPGPNRKMEWNLDVRVDNGSLEYTKFPYRIAELSGRVTFDSTKGRWAFDDLHGIHGAALLSGQGTFVKTSHDDPGALSLNIHAENASLDNDLQIAFPPPTQRVWDLVNPAGKLRVEIGLAWTPGKKPEITVPEARITDGSLEIKTFPYSLEHVTARLALARDPETNCDRLTIFNLAGQHDDTDVRINPGGSAGGESYVLCPSPDDPVGEWQLRLERVSVDNLVLDRTLKNALPPGLRKIIQTLNPQGNLSLLGMLHLRGTQRPTDPVTAAWDITTILTGATITTGVELVKVNGQVTSYGEWDGRRLDMGGRINLHSALLWNHQFIQVQGPFRLKDQELYVGSEEVFRPLAAGERQRPIPNSERLTAGSSFGGTFFLDANLNAEKNTFHVKAVMRDASLAQYARRYMNATTLLQGAMNGWVDLSGTTTNPNDAVGEGKLLIDHAALYELPFFVQVFKAFSFAPVDKTAFYYALANFKIARRRFDFQLIDLIGDAFNLRGRGWATFDGKLRLEFYSRPTKAWQIPIVRDLTQGWFGVRVTGTVQNPRTDSTSPQVDEFLKAFNPRAIPQLSPPPWMTTFPLMVNPRPRSASTQPLSPPAQ